MAFGGVALKSLSLFLRIIEFCCAAIILGIFSYYLSVLADHDLHIDTYLRAVEGISGIAVIYTILAFILVCFLGGIAFFAFLGILLDIAFCGAFIYMAYATRGGDGSCNGHVNTPLGSGDTANENHPDNGTGGVVYLPSFRTACKLETACFAVAIVGAVFFLLSAFVEYALAKHHKREKAFGPGPNNGYTAGSTRKPFWRRTGRGAGAAGVGEKNGDALPTHATPGDVEYGHGTTGGEYDNGPHGTAVPQTYGNTTSAY